MINTSNRRACSLYRFIHWCTCTRCAIVFCDRGSAIYVCLADRSIVFNTGVPFLNNLQSGKYNNDDRNHSEHRDHNTMTGHHTKT